MKFNNNNPTSVKYNEQTVNLVRHNGNVVWVRPYTFLVSKTNESYFSRLEFVRTFTYSGAGVGTIVPGQDTIYYGDIIKVYASAKASTYSYNNWNISSVSPPQYYQQSESITIVKNPNAFAVTLKGIPTEKSIGASVSNEIVSNIPGGHIYGMYFRASRSRTGTKTDYGFTTPTTSGLLELDQQGDETYLFQVTGTPTFSISGTASNTAISESGTIDSITTDAFIVAPITIQSCTDAGNFKRNIKLYNPNHSPVSCFYTPTKEAFVNISNGNMTTSAVSLDALSTSPNYTIADREGFDDNGIAVYIKMTQSGFGSSYEGKLITYITEEVVSGTPYNNYGTLFGSVANYSISFTKGNYVSNAFVSLSSTATSGSPSGTTYPSGTTVYYFVEIYPNDSEYSYTCSGTHISGNIYRLGSVTLNQNTNLNTISGVTRTTRSYPLTINKGTGIANIYYKVDNGNWITWSSGTPNIPYGATIDWYATASSGYRLDIGSGQLYMDEYGATINATAIKTYSVTFSAGSNVQRAWVSISSNGSVEGASGATFDTDTTIYYFVEKNANTTKYTYTCSGTLVSGNVYRLGSVVMNSDKSLGALSSTTVTINKYNVTITKGTGIANIYYKKQGDSSWTTWSSGAVAVEYDSTFSWYAVPITGYSGSNLGTASNPNTFTMGTSATISPSASINWYSVSFTAGSYIERAFLSTSSTGETEDASDTLYPYGTTVYAFVQKYANTTQYSYTVSGTQISGNLYRVGSVTVDGNETFGTLSATRTTNKYAVTFSAGSYVQNAFISTNANGSNASASGTTFDYGTTIYYFVTKNANTTQYTYTCSGTLVSGNIYRLGSEVVNGAKALGTLSSVTRTTNSYPVTITKNTGIANIYYRIDSGSWNTWSSGTVNVPYGSTFYWYATASTGYTGSSLGTQSSPNSFTMNTTSASVSPTATINSYAVTFSAGNYVQGAFLSTNPTDTSGSASGTTFNHGTTVYYFVIKNDNTTQYTYTCSGTQVSGNIYRLGSVVVDSAKALGSLSSVTRTTNKYAVTFSLGSYVTNGFLSTNPTDTSGSASGTTYDYGTTVYYFITKYGNDSQYTYTSTGTQISGNIYRLGSVTIDGAISLTLGSVTRTTNNYTLTITKNTGVANIYYKIGSGSWNTWSSGTIPVPYGSTVSWYATASSHYTIANAGSQSSPNTLTMGSSGATISPTATLISYSVTVTKNTGIADIYYKIGSGNWYVWNGGTISATYNATVYWYATAMTGYTGNSLGTQASPNSFTMGESATISPTATIKTYAVTFSPGNYITGAFTSTDANATSGNISGTQYNHGTTVYYFVVKNANTAQYNYTCSGTLVGNNVYRLGSITMDGAKALGTLSSVTRTLRSYQVSFTKGNYVDYAYLSTDANGGGNEDESGTYYTYGTTVYCFAEKYANTNDYTYTINGTQISGNLYRVGSVTVDGTEDFGTLNATRITRYSVSMSAGTGVSQVFSSTSSTATTGNTSGTKYDSGITVYIFARMQAGYVISGATLVSGTAGEVGAVYRIASKTLSSNWAYGTINGVSVAGWHTVFSGNLYFGIPDDVYSYDYDGVWKTWTTHSHTQAHIVGNLYGEDNGNQVFSEPVDETLNSNNSLMAVQASDFPDHGFIYGEYWIYDDNSSIELGAYLYIDDIDNQYAGVSASLVEIYY